MRLSLARLTLLSFASVALFSVGPGQAHALDLYDDDGTTVSASLFVRSGLEVVSENGEFQDPAPRVYQARLGLKVEREGLGDADLIAEGRSGTLQLLDLRLRLRPIDQFELGSGRYRPHFGLEFHQSRTTIPFRSRSASTSIGLPRSFGTHIAFISSGGNDIDGSRIDIGLVSPSFTARSSSSVNEEGYVTVRLQLHLQSRFIVHAAVAERAYGGSDALEARDQTRVSAGVQYRGERANALVEFSTLTRRLDGDPVGETEERALSFFAFYRTPVGNHELKPVVGLDITNDPLLREDVTNVRTRLGLQYSMLGDSVATGLMWDWNNPGASVNGHALNYYLQFLL